MEEHKRVKIEEKLRQLILLGNRNPEERTQSDTARPLTLKVIRRRKGSPDAKIS